MCGDYIPPWLDAYSSGCGFTQTNCSTTGISTGARRSHGQKKNPFLLAGYTPSLIIKLGVPSKKKVSLKDPPPQNRSSADQ